MADAHHGSHGSGGKSSWVGKAIGGLVLFAIVIISYGIYYLSTSRQTSTDIVLGGQTPPAQASPRGQVQTTAVPATIILTGTIYTVPVDGVTFVDTSPYKRCLQLTNVGSVRYKDSWSGSTVTVRADGAPGSTTQVIFSERSKGNSCS